MKTWNDIKKDYLKDHRSKVLKQPQRREDALNSIERLLKSNYPSLPDSDKIKTLGRVGLEQEVLKLKGSNLSGAEKSVIVGLVKYSE